MFDAFDLVAILIPVAAAIIGLSALMSAAVFVAALVRVARGKMGVLDMVLFLRSPLIYLTRQKDDRTRGQHKKSRWYSERYEHHRRRARNYRNN